MTAEAGPRRVHDLELFAVALTLLAKGSVPEDEIVKRLRAKARELHRRRAGMGFITSAEGKGRSLAKGTVRETVRELASFGLVQNSGLSDPHLTPAGESVARHFASDHSSTPGMQVLASHHLRRYPNLRRLLARLEIAPDGLIFVPRPTPTDLGVAIAARDLEAYEPYIKAASDYTAAELRHWGIPRVRADSVYRSVRREADLKATTYRKMRSLWTHRIMIDTIRDALSRYALSKWVPTVGVVDFEIYCSRGSTLGLLNYTDRLHGTYGRVTYATSWSSPDRAPSWIRRTWLSPLRVTADGQESIHYLHTPRWPGIRARFLSELFEAYDRLNRQKRSLYVVVADVRDIVCYRMRLPDAAFDRFLARVYHESMQGKVDRIRISLEADEVKEARGAQSTKRNPLYLGGSAPRTMIHVSRRHR